MSRASSSFAVRVKVRLRDLLLLLILPFRKQNAALKKKIKKLNSKIEVLKEDKEDLDGKIAKKVQEGKKTKSNLWKIIHDKNSIIDAICNQ